MLAHSSRGHPMAATVMAGGSTGLHQQVAHHMHPSASHYGHRAAATGPLVPPVVGGYQQMKPYIGPPLLSNKKRKASGNGRYHQMAPSGVHHEEMMAMYGTMPPHAADPSQQKSEMSSPGQHRDPNTPSPPMRHGGPPSHMIPSAASPC
eukprot:Trichotokara_eunicae@DN9690_c0_g1_i1.p1